jgi:hypothetical protein
MKKGNYNSVLEVIKSYEDNVMLIDFYDTFNDNEDISKEDFVNFCYEYIDDASEIKYINMNWRLVLNGEI